MLEQTKTAYQRMLAAGWKRGEFSARAPVTMIHHVPTYGDAIITTFQVQKAVDLTPAMLTQGLSLIHFTRNGVVACVHIGSDGKGKLERCDLATSSAEKDSRYSDSPSHEATEIERLSCLITIKEPKQHRVIMHSVDEDGRK